MEGKSVRATARLFGVRKTTILKPIEDAGRAVGGAAVNRRPDEAFWPTRARVASGLRRLMRAGAEDRVPRPARG
jgi:hypothetical protein